MALLSKILYGRKFLLILTICSSVLTAVVTLWWNAQLGVIINTVSAGTSPPINKVFWALVTMLIMGVTNYTKSYLSGYTCEGITHDLRMGYARYFISLPVAVAEELNVGKQLSKLQNEIAGVSGYLNSNLFQLLDDGVRFLSTFVWLLFINPVLTLASNLPALIVVAYVFLSSKIIGLANEQCQKVKGQMNQYADTLLTMFPIILLYDATRITLEGYTREIKSWEYHNVRLERTKARLMSLSGVLSSIPLLFLFLVGGHMAIRGILTVGTLYIFLNLSGNVSGVMMKMPEYITAFRQFSTNMKRLSPHILLTEKGE